LQEVSSCKKCLAGTAAVRALKFDHFETIPDIFTKYCAAIVGYTGSEDNNKQCERIMGWRPTEDKTKLTSVNLYSYFSGRGTFLRVQSWTKN